MHVSDFIKAFVIHVLVRISTTHVATKGWLSHDVGSCEHSSDLWSIGQVCRYVSYPCALCHHRVKVSLICTHTHIAVWIDAGLWDALAYDTKAFSKSLQSIPCKDASAEIDPSIVEADGHGWAQRHHCALGTFTLSRCIIFLSVRYDFPTCRHLVRMTSVSVDKCMSVCAGAYVHLASAYLVEWMNCILLKNYKNPISLQERVYKETTYSRNDKCVCRSC